MNTLNGQIFKEMLESGCNNLTNQKKEIDARNVFPVPTSPQSSSPAPRLRMAGNCST